ncbi:MAG: hypothetical protein AB1603_02185 [Chloroflexota bacterium]
MAKRLYAVLWVDDCGSMPLSRKDVDWYHRNAGPISLALENDDRFPWSFRRMLGPGAPDLSTDYLSHHYHAVRWKGLSLPKKLYDLLHLHWHVRAFMRRTSPDRLSKRAFRLAYGATFLSGIALAVYLYFLNTLAFALFLAAFLTILSLAVDWFYVQHPRNWQNLLADAEWHRSFLVRIKGEFNRRGREYPALVRHGWDLPPEGTMSLYLSEMGVLADASATPTTHEGHPSVAGRHLSWSIQTPYYASLSRGYNQPWDGHEETDRGLLELPVVLGNIAAYGFGDAEKDIIASLPADGLVAAYIHPWDRFEAVKEWVSFLKTNYDVRFVRADEYLESYMRRYPRPVVLRSDLKPRWAFKHDDRLCPIRETPEQTVTARVQRVVDDLVEVEVEVGTETPVPELAFEVQEMRVPGFELRSGQYVALNVAPGKYRFKVRP